MRRRAFKWWREHRTWAHALVVASAVALTFLVALFVLKWAPEWLAQPDLTGDKRAEDVGRNRTAILATLAGMIALAGAVFTGLSYRLNRAGQITDRFTKAIDQLGATDENGNPKIDIVLGGIYALERIAWDSKDDHPQVVEVLTAYVREHARYQPEAPAATTSSEPGQNDEAASSEAVSPGVRPRLAADVQAAMSVLARRDITQDREGYRLNLAGADLRRLVVIAREGGHLERGILDRAHLEGADLNDAQLDMPILSARTSKAPTSTWRISNTLTSSGRTFKGHTSGRRTSKGPASRR